MASRSKKKLQNKDIELTQNKIEIVNSTNNKDNIIYSIFIILCIAIFIFLFFAPIMSIKINIEGEEQEEEQETQSYKMTTNASVYRIIFAPARGVYNILEYLLDDAGINSNVSSSAISIDYDKLMSEDDLKKFNNFGKSVFVLSFIMLFTYFLFITLSIIDTKKGCKNILRLIGASLNFITIFIVFMLGLIALFENNVTICSIMPGWGLWLILFMSMIILGIVVYIFIKQRKEAKDEVH